MPLCVPAPWDTAPASWPGAVGLTRPLRLTTRRRREAPASPLPSFARVPRSREQRFLLSTRRSADRTRPTFSAGGDPRRHRAGGHATLPPPSARRMLRPAGPCGRAPEPATPAGGGARRHEAAAGGPLAGAPDAQRRRLGRARRGGLGTMDSGGPELPAPELPVRTAPPSDTAAPSGVPVGAQPIRERRISETAASAAVPRWRRTALTGYPPYRGLSPQPKSKTPAGHTREQSPLRWPCSSPPKGRGAPLAHEEQGLRDRPQSRSTP